MAKNKKISSPPTEAPGSRTLLAPSGNPLEQRETPAFQMLVAAVWTAVIIMLVHIETYKVDMTPFFWTSAGAETRFDFFSLVKVHFIVICAVLALLILLFRALRGNFTFKRSFIYIPMAVYTVFVVLSYLCSDYQQFALWGWSERFEGTIPLLCYMLLLFYIFNSVNTERCVKWILYPLAVTSAMLCVLGLTQLLDIDFFRSYFGRWLICFGPYTSVANDLHFTFQNREIYQTVYNINYVSFYLTLLLPIFTLFFLRADSLKWRVIWGAEIALLFVNLIGSKSSGGILGLAVAFLVALIVCNRKLLNWIKPLAALILIFAVIAALTFSLWGAELSGAFHNVVASDPGRGYTEEGLQTTEAASLEPYIDYFETGEKSIALSINHEDLLLKLYLEEQTLHCEAFDGSGAKLDTQHVGGGKYVINDERFFAYLAITFATDEEQHLYAILNTSSVNFQFFLNPDDNCYYYQTVTGYLIPLKKTASIGFQDDLHFGTNRGYIWSRSFPLMKQAALLGFGADTFCVVFPQDDIAGKYSCWGVAFNMIVDKPHSWYIGMGIGTGGISLLAMLVLFAYYVIQSFRIYPKRRFESFLDYAGAGIFIGVCGFLTAALVDDSSVSIMPMFYGLLATGLAINRILRAQSAPEKAAPREKAQAA